MNVKKKLPLKIEIKKYEKFYTHIHKLNVILVNELANTLYEKVLHLFYEFYKRFK